MRLSVGESGDAARVSVRGIICAGELESGGAAGAGVVFDENASAKKLDCEPPTASARSQA